MTERQSRSPCLKAFARFHLAFACAALPCTAFAQSDPMQLARLVNANQTGVMEYCQGQGWADQTAVDAQKANASSLPPATDTTEISAAEATGKTGSLFDNSTAMPLSLMAAQTHTTVEACAAGLPTLPRGQLRNAVRCRAYPIYPPFRGCRPCLEFLRRSSIPRLVPKALRAPGIRRHSLVEPVPTILPLVTIATLFGRGRVDGFASAANVCADVEDVVRGLGRVEVRRYVRCWEKNLFISNIVALSLPKIFLSAASAMISRLLAGFWRLFFLIYSQTLLTTSPRGSGSDPTITARSSDGCRGFCKAFGALPALGGDTFFPFTGAPAAFSELGFVLLSVVVFATKPNSFIIAKRLNG
jgi:hypothetical protein